MRDCDSDFVPALGWRPLTPLYDGVVRLLSREAIWRRALLDQLAPKPGERILDVGCGTGSFALMIKAAEPSAHVFGLDPDPDVLDRAAAKARAAGVDVEWQQGFARDASGLGTRFEKAVSSLVFHQVPIAEKRAGIRAMVDAVHPGGAVHIADFARQRGPVMKALFGLVGLVDGHANTSPNAAGVLEDLIGATAPGAAQPMRVIRTLLGEISLFTFRTPDGGNTESP